MLRTALPAVRRLTRDAISVLAALSIAGCVTGSLSPASVVDANQLYRPTQPGGAAGSCFHYGEAESSQPPSLRPGDRIQLTVWAAGTQDPSYLNTYPPLAQPIDLRLRNIEAGRGKLDTSEQQVLATFLQLNRADTWTEGAGGPAGITRDDRVALAKTLEGSEGKLWNAFIGSLCLRSVPIESGVADRRVFVLEASMRALCEALEAGAQPRFARAFLTSKAQPDEYKKGCAAAALAREPMTVVGIQRAGGHAGWASAALDANKPLEADNYFTLDRAYSSPMAILGAMSFRAVAPFGKDAPDWTLREWQSSGICGSALIRKVRLLDGSQSFRIVDDTSYVTTHTLDVTSAARVLTTHRPQLDWSLPVAALDDLRAADVDAIVWSVTREPRSPTVAAPGCSKRGQR